MRFAGSRLAWGTANERTQANKWSAPDADGKLGTSEENSFNEGRQVLSEQEELNTGEQRAWIC